MSGWACKAIPAVYGFLDRSPSMRLAGATLPGRCRGGRHKARSFPRSGRGRHRGWPARRSGAHGTAL